MRKSKKTTALIPHQNLTPGHPRWFEFRQNNSGGSFIYDHHVGITVYIQAFSPQEANTKAQQIGIYFDGVGEDGYDDDGEPMGRDCPCCGDRWYSLWENEEGKTDFPQITLYVRGKNWVTRDYALFESPTNLEGYDVLHYIDGTIHYAVPVFLDNETSPRVI